MCDVTWQILELQGSWHIIRSARLAKRMANRDTPALLTVDQSDFASSFYPRPSWKCKLSCYHWQWNFRWMDWYITVSRTLDIQVGTWFVFELSSSLVANDKHDWLSVNEVVATYSQNGFQVPLQKRHFLAGFAQGTKFCCGGWSHYTRLSSCRPRYCPTTKIELKQKPVMLRPAFLQLASTDSCACIIALQKNDAHVSGACELA